MADKNTQVEKEKFDAILQKLIKAKPLPQSKVRTRKRKTRP